jgi:cell volume regulation protein A
VFISWVGLRGAVAIFLASIPLLVGLPGAQTYFDVAFIAVVVSLLIQGWTIAPAARRLGIALPRQEVIARRVELDLPGQLEQELVGYSVNAQSAYLRRGLLPSWAKPTLVVRDEEIYAPADAGPVRDGDYLYLLAPPEKAQALDRFFVEMPPPKRPDPRLLGDFFVSGDTTLGALAEIYGVGVPAEHMGTSLADHIVGRVGKPVREGEVVPLDSIVLVVHQVSRGQVKSVGLRLPEPEPEPERATRALDHFRALFHRAVAWVRGELRRTDQSR